MWNFLLTIQKPHLINCGQIWRHATMHTEYFPIDYSPQRQEIKSLVEILPAVRIPIFSIDLIQEPIHHSNIPALVVAPEQEYPVRVLHLQAKQQSNSLHTVVAPVHKIPNHDELVLWDAASLPEHLLHIVELPMYIACYFDGGIYYHDVGLVNQDALDHVAQ